MLNSNERMKFINEYMAAYESKIKLAEDEMKHQKYNAEYIKNNRDEENFIFIPNIQPKLLGVDNYIKKMARNSIRIIKMK